MPISESGKNRPAPPSARTWFISGRVQGVGFRWFVERQAGEIGLRGWVRNLDDGRVEVYATGTEDQLNRLAGLLHEGPVGSAVRGVEEQEAAIHHFPSFRTR